MTKDFIPELQPLFCSRASLLEAREKLGKYNELDCQLRLRFANGYDIPLKIRRADIEKIVSGYIASVETSISDALDNIMDEEYIASAETPISDALDNIVDEENS